MIQFYYLLLAHLVADFLLQPQKLVDLKRESVLALFVHSTIHFLVMMLLLFPFWMNINVLLVCMIIAVIHAVIDYLRIKIEEQKKRMFVLLFYADQLLHLLFIIIGSLFLSGVPSLDAGNNIILEYYLNPAFIFGFCLLILASHFYEIVIYQKNKEKRKKLKFVPDRRRVLKHLVIAGVVYIFLILFGVYEIAAFAFLMPNM